MKIKTSFISIFLLMMLSIPLSANNQTENKFQYSADSLSEKPLIQKSTKVANTDNTSTSLSKDKKLKIKKQLSLLKMTLNQYKLSSKPTSYSKNTNELSHTEKNRFFHAIITKKNKTYNSQTKKNTRKPLTPLELLNKIKNPYGNISLNSDKAVIVDIDAEPKYDLIPVIDIEKKSNPQVIRPKNIRSNNNIDYWTTVHSIESKQGKLLYRPRNKDRNCTNTSGPCGHHQLTVQALKDIDCHSKQCRKDRLNYKKSLTLSKKLLALNQKRLQKKGITQLEDYEKYLIHQQGAYGIKNIIAATQGRKLLSNKIKRNMANNSPYSYRQLKRMGSTIAAKKFMKHWKSKWKKEQRLVSDALTYSTDSSIKSNFIPTFSENDLTLVLNIRF